MNALPVPAKLYAGFLTGVVCCLALVLAIDEGLPGASRLVAAGASIVFIACAWLRPFPLSFKRKLFLDTSVLAFAILIFEPGMAMIVAGAGTFIAHALRRKDWDEGLFNSAQMMLQAAVGSLVLLAFGYDQTLGELNEPAMLVAIVVAGALMFIVNNAAVAIMIGLQSHMSIRTVGAGIFANADRIEMIVYPSQIGLGVALAVFVLAAPWMIPLLVFPVGAIYLLIERNVTMRWRAELSLRERDLDLAEAQRIAKVGSWRWDLVTGTHVWSDETFHILGINKADRSPNYEELLATVDPADRDAVDAAVHGALYGATPFDLEHRLHRVDGNTRIVQQRGELILDESGTKRAIVGTIQDITERRAMEEQIARFAERDRIEAERAEGRRRLAASRELERLRLARELHDGPVQNLLAISYNLASRERSIVGSPDLGRRIANSEQIRQDILGVVAELRGFVGELRPPGLSEFGLAAALEGYVAELNRRNGKSAPTITIDLDGAADALPESTALTVFRIVQEAIRNSLRHAEADEVEISVSRDDDHLRLTIRDNGAGFNVPSSLSELAERGHFGLIGLVERVDQANGEIDITSTVGVGTSITVSMPVWNEEERRG